MDGNTLLASIKFIVREKAPYPVQVFVIASDEAHLVKKRQRWACIMNCDPRGTVGRRWLLFMYLNNTLEYVDSFNQLPSYYKIQGQPFRRPICKKLSFKMQSDTANTCSLFCLYFLYHRLRNRSFESI
jgi:hypothetical protein